LARDLVASGGSAWHGRRLLCSEQRLLTGRGRVRRWLPLTAAAGGWLFAGREPPAIVRQPIE
jgi:hypothetical protein